MLRVCQKNCNVCLDMDEIADCDEGDEDCDCDDFDGQCNFDAFHGKVSFNSRKRLRNAFIRNIFFYSIVHN